VKLRHCECPFRRYKCGFSRCRRSEAISNLQYAIREMNEQRILEELLALLEANSVTVRNEPLGGSGGGLCTIKGQKIFFMDTQAASAESAAICAEAVSRMVDIEKVYIKPEVRQFIENHSNNERR